MHYLAGPSPATYDKIMNKHDWTYKKLGEVCDIICGQDHKKVASPEGRYPIYGTGGIMGYATEYRCPAFSVIVGRKGSINNPIYVEENYWNVDTAFGIVPSKTNLSSKFFYYFCKNYDFTKHNVAVTIPSLRRIDLLKIPIPVPPIEEQERIVEELDLLSSIIDKKKSQLKAYDQLAQSIFYSMFGDPVTNEKGWEVKRLGEECSEIRYGTSKPACDNGKYKYLRMGNLTSNGELDLSDLKTINVSNEEIENSIVRYGDILLNRTNSLDLVGKTCMFDLEEPMIIAGYIIRVRLTENLSPRYISAMFNMPSMKSLLRKMAKGAVNQANINSKELASILTPIPPIEMQHQFAERIEGIRFQKALVQASIVETETLFNSRMDYWFG